MKKARLVLKFTKMSVKVAEKAAEHLLKRAAKKYDKKKLKRVAEAVLREQMRINRILAPEIKKSIKNIMKSYK